MLARAVAVASPSGSEAELARRLRDVLASRVDQVAIDSAGNLIARSGHGPRAVTLLGHLDTVPGEVPVEVVDGRLYGRGAVDAKGPLCAALAALAGLSAAAGERLTVRVVGAVGEEAPGSVGARHAVLTLPVPELLVICEPSGWDAVTLGYKGHLRLELSCESPSRHSAGPWPSTADLLVEALARIRRSVTASGPDRAEARLFDTLTATVLRIATGHDGLAERADATVSLRLPPAWPVPRVLSLLAEAALPSEVRLRIDEAVPAVQARRDSGLARTFRVAIRAAGGRPRSLVKTGTSDWNVVAAAWDVPTLAYGPGDASLDHTPGEHVELAHYDAAVAVLTTVLEALAGARVQA